jgi:hypothetical protein
MDMKEYLRKLEEVRRTEDDWNGYGSESPSKIAYDNAMAVILTLCRMTFTTPFGLPRATISPSAEGGIGISFSTKEKYGFVECHNDGEILAATSDFDVRDIWKVEKKDIRKALFKLDVFFGEGDKHGMG